MADAAAPLDTATPTPAPQALISNTTAIAMGTSGGGSVVLWLADCVAAGQFVAPSREVCLFLVALVAPIVHALGRVIISRLNRLG